MIRLAGDQLLLTPLDKIDSANDGMDDGDALCAGLGKILDGTLARRPVSGLRSRAQAAGAEKGPRDLAQGEIAGLSQSTRARSGCG